MWATKKIIKDAYPKKVCHMHKRHVEKKRSWTHEGPSIQKKKREIAQCSKKKEFIHHPRKIFTHMHILIKEYDLFLFWIQSLA
jgi:hypothetical protein